MIVVFTEPTASVKVEENGEGMNVVVRIRKMLDRALHPGTPQAEAEQAMRLAQREMHKHQVDQARVFAATKVEDNETVPLNNYFVALRNSAGNVHSNWRRFGKLAQACADAFKVGIMFSARSTGFNFYGGDVAAKAAAETFIKYGKHVVQKTNAYQVPSPESTNIVERTQHNTKHRQSFLMGIVDGLYSAQRRESRQERLHQERMQEYITLYQHVHGDDEVDDDMRDSVNEMAAELGVSGDVSQELSVYQSMDVALAATMEAARAQFYPRGSRPSRRTRARVTEATSYSRGYTLGKRMRVETT